MGRMPEWHRKTRGGSQAFGGCHPGHPGLLEAHRELLSVYTRLHLRSEAAVEVTRWAGSNRMWIPARDPGPQINSFAPDFDLAEVGTGQHVRLREFRGKISVVLVFGNAPARISVPQPRRSTHYSSNTGGERISFSSTSGRRMQRATGKPPGTYGKV